MLGLAGLGHGRRRIGTTGDEHRVEHHRRHAVHRGIDRQHLAVRRLHRRRRGTDDLGQCALLGQLGLERIDRRTIDAVGHQDRHLARLDIARYVIHQAQRRRALRGRLLRRYGRRARHRQAEVFGHAAGQLQVDVGEDFIDLPLADEHPLHLAQLEGIGADDVLLLRRTHAVPEQRGLGEVVAEGFAAVADLVPLDPLRIALEAAALGRRRGFLGPAAVDRVGLVVGAALVDRLAMEGVALVVVERAQRAVDRDLVEVRPTETQQLGVGVGEQPALQQRVIREVDARHDVADVEGGLLGLGEEVVRVAIEGHLAELLHRHQLLGDELGRVEQVEVELVLVSLFHHLHAQLPLEVVAHLDGLPHVAAVEVRVLASDLQRLVPDQRESTGHRLPVELDETADALGIDQAEGVHAEAFHRPVAARQGAVGHGPEHHVCGLRRQRDEVPESVVGRLRLRDLVVRLGFDRVDEVRKLDGILDEEHWHVVADQVEVALVGVELGGKAAHVAHGVRRAARALHGGEAHEYRGLLALCREERGLGQLAVVVVADEHAVCGGTARVDDALGDAFMIEVGELLAHDEVFEQRGPTAAGLEGVLVIGDLHALIGAQRLAGGVRAKAFQLVELGIAVAAVDGIGASQFALFGGLVGHLGPR